MWMIHTDALSHGIFPGKPRVYFQAPVPEEDKEILT
jgi:hypothetical protein